MYSARFHRPIIVTRHASLRMAERSVSEELLVRVVDTGEIRYADASHLWSWLDVPGRSDNRCWCWKGL